MSQSPRGTTREERRVAFWAGPPGMAAFRLAELGGTGEPRSGPRGSEAGGFRRRVAAATHPETSSRPHACTSGNSLSRSCSTRWPVATSSRGASAGAAWASCFWRAKCVSTAASRSSCCRPPRRPIRSPAPDSCARRGRRRNSPIPTSSPFSVWARWATSSTTRWRTSRVRRWASGCGNADLFRWSRERASCDRWRGRWGMRTRAAWCTAT